MSRFACVDPSSPPGCRAAPCAAGIGLRAQHQAEVMASHPPVGWFEVHAENHFGGGAALHHLEVVRRDYPVSLHGVGLSLGSAAGIDRRHLERLAGLAERIEPGLVSEHLSWSIAGGLYFNDLIPLPLTEEALGVVSRNILRVQDRLRRRILIENPSAYLRFADSPIPEPEFLAALVARTGCGLLCDVNNIYVSAGNLGGDPLAWLDAVPAAAVGEIHLAGHHRTTVDGVDILIDDHGSRVAAEVWALYRHAVARFPAAPTLIEWDTAIPPLAELVAEAHQADRQRARGLADAGLREVRHDVAA